MNEITSIKVCPLCGQTYWQQPAISREDNETHICPDCGIRQALAGIGIQEEERETILGIIHRYDHR